MNFFPTTNSRSVRRILLGGLGLLLSATMAFAQSTGAVTGRVVDASTGLVLSGVRITVPGTALQTYSAADGGFTLLDVPAGETQLTLSYVGYPDYAQAATVTAGDTAILTVKFGDDIIAMDRFVIEGSLVGTARAINQQRAAATLTNLVASDEIGNFPDQNAAEALQRIPGLALYRDQGEGRYIVVRGLNFALNGVSLNGAKLASPEEGDRGIALDVIPADALASVEVFKVSTPDMDGEGLGGQINIKTKSPFDEDGLAASFKAETTYSDLADEFGYKFSGKVSTVTADGKIGLYVAPTYQTRKFGSYNFEQDGWGTENSPTDGKDYYFFEAVNFRDYEIERERSGVSAAIEGRPTEDANWYLQFNYNKFKDTEQRTRTVIDFTEGDIVALDATSATLEDLRRYRRDLRDRVKEQELTALILGGDVRFGQWTLDGKIAYSKGHEENPDETSYRFRQNTKDGTFTYSFPSGPYSLQVVQTAGGLIEDPSVYEFQRVELTNDSGDETNIDSMINARYDFEVENPTFVKFGAAFRTKEKTSEVEYYEYDGGPADFTFSNLVGEVSAYPYFHVPRFDLEKIRAAFVPNKAAFDSERGFEDSELDDWVSHEDVLAAYLMASTKVDKATYIAGVRMERTEFDTTGKDVDLDLETVSPLRESKSYTNWLPGVYFRYDVSNDLVIRASYSNSLARPSFGDSAARLGINVEDEEVTLGNPQLDALESQNWDASVEYYLPSLGLVSASAFYKEIKNFSYEVKFDDAYDYQGTDFDLITFRNGSSGEVRGIELAWQQQLTMLPAPFDGIGLLANITFSDSKATYDMSERAGEEIPLIGQSDRVGNLAITYEKGGFFARAALNFRSPRLREDESLGGDKYEDLYVDNFAQLDLTARYRFNRNWEIYADMANVTNEPFRVYLNSPDGQGKRLAQFEEYGWSASLGIRWKL